MASKKKHKKDNQLANSPSFANDKLGENRDPEFEDILIPEKKNHKKSKKK